MNNHGNRHVPRFTSNYTKRRTRYRAMERSRPKDFSAVSLHPGAPSLDALPSWFERTVYALASLRRELFAVRKSRRESLA